MTAILALLFIALGTLAGVGFGCAWTTRAFLGECGEAEEAYRRHRRTCTRCALAKVCRGPR